MLTFKNVKIAVEQRQLLGIDELSLTKGPIALVGRNGAGKSTFLRTIMGMNAVFTGDITIQGHSILNLSKAELAKEVAIVFSKSSIFGNHTGREVLMLGRLPYQNVFAKETVDDIDVVNNVVDTLQISGFVDRTFERMSDGERQLIMIGRAMVQNSKIILLDEPGAFLDLVNRHKLLKVIQQLSTEKLIVFSTHDIAHLDTICEGVLLIENKEMLYLTEKGNFENRIRQSFGIEKALNEI